MIDFAPLPARKAVQCAVYREIKRKHDGSFIVDREQAIVILCKRRGWNEAEVRELVKRKPRARPKNGDYRKPSMGRDVYDAKMARISEAVACVWDVSQSERRAIIEAVAYKEGVTTQQVDAIAGRSKPRTADPTPEEIKAACARIREGWSEQVAAVRQGIFYQPYVVPGTTIRHNLNGMSDGRKAWHDGDSEQN